MLDYAKRARVETYTGISTSIQIFFVKKNGTKSFYLCFVAAVKSIFHKCEFQTIFMSLLQDDHVSSVNGVLVCPVVITTEH